jgi:hypothetical protein
MQIFRKQPDEIYPVTIDFSARLPTGLTISSAAGSVTNLATDASENAMLSSTTLTVSSGNVTGKVTGGSHGTDYRITFKATLSDSSVLEEDLLMQVRGD